MDKVVAEKTSDLTSYQITASPETIATMIDAMSQTWDQSESTSLTLAAGANAAMLEIQAIKLQQVKQLIIEQDSTLLSQMATRFAAANLNSTPLSPGEPITGDNLPPVNQPILTGRYDPPSVPLQTQPPIKLRICIERTAR
jgi:hypothetical protein